jgi:hypothetical protein
LSLGLFVPNLMVTVSPATVVPVIDTGRPR